MADLAHLTLGNFRVTLIRNGCFWWDGGVYFGIVPKTLWAKRMPPDEANRVPLAFNSYLIETPEKTVLIETGGGHLFDEKARDRMRIPAPGHTTSRIICRARNRSRKDRYRDQHPPPLGPLQRKYASRQARLPECPIFHAAGRTRLRPNAQPPR